ncbi:hypothetical protein [Microcoleus vaginatus]|uniref:hypothetical protein n=1 Tax=Microcoleus vaginatus TaxID=119532 RepID=UPI004040706F
MLSSRKSSTSIQGSDSFPLVCGNSGGETKRDSIDSAKFASSLRSPPVNLRVEAEALALSSNFPSEA